MRSDRESILWLMRNKAISVVIMHQRLVYPHLITARRSRTEGWMCIKKDVEPNRCAEGNGPGVLLQITGFVRYSGANIWCPSARDNPVYHSHAFTSKRQRKQLQKRTMSAGG